MNINLIQHRRDFNWVLKKINSEFQAFGQYSNNILTYHFLPPLRNTDQPSTLDQKEVILTMVDLGIAKIIGRRKPILSKDNPYSLELLIDPDFLDIFVSTWTHNEKITVHDLRFITSKDGKYEYLLIGEKTLATKSPHSIQWLYLRYLVSKLNKHCSLEELYIKSTAHSDPYPPKGKRTVTNRTIRRNIDHLRNLFTNNEIPLSIITSQGVKLVFNQS